jgi:hypothetical protein
MKKLVLSIVGVFFLALSVTLGLFLTGHLIVVPTYQIDNYIGIDGKVLYSEESNKAIYYRVVFVK